MCCSLFVFRCLFCVVCGLLGVVSCGVCFEFYGLSDLCFECCGLLLLFGVVWYLAWCCCVVCSLLFVGCRLSFVVCCVCYFGAWCLVVCDCCVLIGVLSLFLMVGA